MDCQIRREQYGKRGGRAYEEDFLDHSGILSGIVNAATKQMSETRKNAETGRFGSLGAVSSDAVCPSAVSKAFTAPASSAASPSVASASRLEVS